MNKRAVALAMDSEHGEQLLQITQEHVRAAKEYICFRSVLTPERESELQERIEHLRGEREIILQQFIGQGELADA
ncbi:MAG: hypothetical protein K6T85_07750 [Gorillibacterium sp.]|nr:hypothetical protein [Gorillibacterium sp.]